MRFRHGLRYCTLAQRLGYSAFRRYGVLHSNLKKKSFENNHRISCNAAGATTTYRGLLLTSAQIQITPLKKKHQLFRYSSLTPENHIAAGWYFRCGQVAHCTGRIGNVSN